MIRERLDKVIASRSTFSRKEARNLIKDGNVRVNGELATEPHMTVVVGCDSLALFEKPFKAERFVYIMLNKPQGVLSASRDANAKTVLDLVPDSLMRRGLFPAGRLDKDTTGLLIITDDGDFSHRMLSPRKKVPKTYRAYLRDPLVEDGCSLLESGINLKDGTRCRPAQARILPQEGENIVEIILTEGKYHQVKRMFAALGNEVQALERTHIGSLELDPNLKLGQCRELKPEEVCKIIMD
ncbi:MAG: 16S rRNA pseudouridine(516) synthase [Clostridiales bacterium]|nr:16S rRNA pseudouridine(516) synthase [Clostridiales bacterium]